LYLAAKLLRLKLTRRKVKLVEFTERNDTYYVLMLLLRVMKNC